MHFKSFFAFPPKPLKNTAQNRNYFDCSFNPLRTAAIALRGESAIAPRKPQSPRFTREGRLFLDPAHLLAGARGVTCVCMGNDLN